MMHAIAKAPPHEILSCTYEEARNRLVLVAHRAEQELLLALLRFDGAEHPATRERLRQLRFETNGGPARSAISWRRPTATAELRPVADSLREALGDAAVLDVGTFFALPGEAFSRARLPEFWRGRFLLHVGGTGRCVTFDSQVAEHELARALEAGREAYFANDFHPATE